MALGQCIESSLTAWLFNGLFIMERDGECFHGPGAHVGGHTVWIRAEEENGGRGVVIVWGHRGAIDVKRWLTVPLTHTHIPRCIRAYVHLRRYKCIQSSFCQHFYGKRGSSFSPAHAN